MEPVLEDDSFRRSINKYIRQDLLRTYIFFNNTVKSPGGISLRCKEGSIRLSNCCNWIWEDMMKDYMKKYLPDINSVDQACKELISGKSRRGRRPDDERVPVLLWGTYRMLSEKYGFKSSMPNCLCEFMIALLQIQGVFALDTDIDEQWIRAQLRYIKSKAQKPSFSRKEDQSSIMKGAQ